MNTEYNKIKNRLNIKNLMYSFKNFEKISDDLIKDDYYREQKTLVIDFKDTFVS